MKTNSKTLKTIVFSLVLAAMTLTANNMNAQNDDSRGILGRGTSVENPQNGSKTLFHKNGDRDGENTYDITNNGIGQENAPLGSGIAILIGAGLGYVALKKKED